MEFSFKHTILYASPLILVYFFIVTYYFLSGLASRTNVNHVLDKREDMDQEFTEGIKKW